jgi:hypothetical protein
MNLPLINRFIDCHFFTLDFAGVLLTSQFTFKVELVERQVKNEWNDEPVQSKVTSRSKRRMGFPLRIQKVTSPLKLLTELI